MTILIIGLGSMGKRRVRNLQSLGGHEIIGLEPKEENRKETEEKYGIKTASDIKDIDLSLIDAIIISTPPDKHNEWIEFAIENLKPAFVEASVVLEGLEELNEKAKASKVLIAPSCTFKFHPALARIIEIVRSGKYGKVTNFNYHQGFYLPDWHPWEKVSDVYFGKKETSGAREMVAFELTWLTEAVGWPEAVKGFYGRTMDLGADIDDTYVIALKLKNGFGNLTIDTTARAPVRDLILNLEKAQILWNWDHPLIKLYDAETKTWQEIKISMDEATEGYNPNITESMYIDEVRAFMGAVQGKSPFPNTLEDDIKVLKILNEIESQKN